MAVKKSPRRLNSAQLPCKFLWNINSLMDNVAKRRVWAAYVKKSHLN